MERVLIDGKYVTAIEVGQYVMHTCDAEESGEEDKYEIDEIELDIIDCESETGSDFVPGINIEDKNSESVSD